MRMTLVVILLMILSCEEKLEKNQNNFSYKVKKERSYENDVRKFNDLVRQNYPRDTVNINSDNIPDYILYSMFGDKYFFDGATKRQIPAKITLSKAGTDLELKIIDINCGDNQKEFILQNAGGGTLGNYHGFEILRYNSKTKTIQPIFSGEISSFHWDEENEILEYVNYIDILYKKNTCNDTIKIYQGKFIDKEESYNLKIKPIKLIKSYYFDRKSEIYIKNFR